MLRTVLLAAHVAAGTAGLVLGPPVLVVSVGGWMSWLLPSRIGIVIVEYAAAHVPASSADGSRERVDHVS